MSSYKCVIIVIFSFRKKKHLTLFDLVVDDTNLYMFIPILKKMLSSTIQIAFVLDWHKKKPSFFLALTLHVQVIFQHKTYLVIGLSEGQERIKH